MTRIVRLSELTDEQLQTIAAKFGTYTDIRIVRWHPVSDPPPEYGLYLVVYEDAVGNKVVRMNNWDSRQIWWDESDGAPTMGVEHWAELPIPPR